MTNKEYIKILQSLQDWLYLCSMNGGARLQREAIDKAIEALSQPEPNWIPVTEWRLPEIGKSVLICDVDGDICIGHRTRSGYYFPDFCDDKIKNVRAWCELPEPYKEVAE